MLMHKGGFNPCKKLFIQLSLINLTNIICLNNFLHFYTKKKQARKRSLQYSYYTRLKLQQKIKKATVKYYTTSGSCTYKHKTALNIVYFWVLGAIGFTFFG